MALSLSQTEALGRLMSQGMKIASMGYPDIIAPTHMLQDMLGSKFDLLEYRADSEAICARHMMENHQVPDAESFFKIMQCELDVFDIVNERGCEILIDLNHKLDDKYLTQYDLVLDVGTAEHCFNIAQAVFNMAGLLKIGGVILHENPFNWGNHGFYNLNPTWYADFYQTNGFKLLDIQLVAKDGNRSPVTHTKRFRFTEQEVNVFAVAQREEIKPFVYPCQTKYKR